MQKMFEGHLIKIGKADTAFLVINVFKDLLKD